MLTRRSLLAAALAPAPARPNVLLFLSDQESALLPGPVKTPHRDRLIAAGGVRFSHAFCNTPQCSPARAAIMTGLHPHKAGVLTNVDGSSLGKGLPADRTTLGRVFQSAGYTTAYFGKWHLGGKGPSAFGFSTAVEGNNDESSAADAAAWIAKQKTPWMAVVSILNPHHIYEIPGEVAHVQARPGVTAPASGLENLKNKPAEQMQFVEQDQGKLTRHFTVDQWVKYRSFYCSLVEKADRCLGTVLDAVNLNDTVVMASTDHGDQLGEHGLPFKGPFLYEELIRIPLVVAGPGAAKLKRAASDLVTQTDYAPTLAGLAGLEWTAPTDGRDLTKPAPPRDAILLEYYAKQKWVNPIRCIRTRRYKFTWYDRGNRELYDLQQDPHELEDLAASPAHAARVKEFEQRLTAWRGPML